VRRCLSRWEIGEILLAGRRIVWPELNNQPVRLVARRSLPSIWAPIGIDFKFASLSWSTGLSLLGFYATISEGLLRRPLIHVNIAHHPAIVGVALDHEMGHHLTSYFLSEDRTIWSA